MVIVKRVSNFNIRYKTKPFGWYRDCDIGYGLGIFWITESYIGQNCFFYHLASFPENLSFGNRGYHSFEEACSHFNTNYGPFKRLTEDSSYA